MCVFFFRFAPKKPVAGSTQRCCVSAEHLEELTGLVTEHMVRMCQHVGDEEVERAKTQVCTGRLVVLTSLLLLLCAFLNAAVDKYTRSG